MRADLNGRSHGLFWVAMLGLFSACSGAGASGTAARRPAVAATQRTATHPAGSPLAATPCNDRRIWSTTSWSLAKRAGRDVIEHAEQAAGATLAPPASPARAKAERAARGAVFWWMIRAMTVEGQRHNAAALPLKGLSTRSGAPLWLVRSAYTATPDRPGSCFHALVHRGGVRHVLNLYDGEMYNADLEAGEARVVNAKAGTYVHPKGGDTWRGDMRAAWKAWKAASTAEAKTERRLAYLASRRAAAVAVAALINQHLLRPGGAAPEGHLHVHCGGGMHRTGMVVGVLDRCINGAPMSRVEADYKRHVAWESAARPGGFEPQNLDFIAHFPCPLLKR